MNSGPFAEVDNGQMASGSHHRYALNVVNSSTCYDKKRQERI